MSKCKLNSSSRKGPVAIENAVIRQRNCGHSVYTTTMHNNILYIYSLLLNVSAIDAIFRQLVHTLLLARNIHIGQCLHVNSS